MSSRNRSETPGPDRKSRRSKEHGRRHRVHEELHQIAEAVNAGAEPDDVPEPAPTPRPEAVHDHHQRKTGRRYWLRHWKTKDWKRRKGQRSLRNRRRDRDD